MGRIGVIAALATVAAFSAPAGAVESETDVRGAIRCLALNIYFEARNEPVDGKLAVGHVVLNRVADSRYPNNICKVVKQGGEGRRYKCQFSWFCDGLSDQPRNTKAWKESQVLARVIFWGYSEDPTNGALWYHAEYVKPYWQRSMEQGPKIGRHLFYVADLKRGKRRAPPADQNAAVPDETTDNGAVEVAAEAKRT